MRPEDRIHKGFVKYMQLHYPEVLMTHSPAGVVMSGAMRVKMKTLGYQNGTPDLMIFKPSGHYHGMFIEFKAPKGKVSKDQMAYLEALIWQGCHAIVCRSVEEAVKAWEVYIRKSIPEL